MNFEDKGDAINISMQTNIHNNKYIIVKMSTQVRLNYVNCQENCISDRCYLSYC